jgi:hypothetical protein
MDVTESCVWASSEERSSRCLFVAFSSAVIFDVTQDRSLISFEAGITLKVSSCGRSVGPLLQNCLFEDDVCIRRI